LHIGATACNQRKHGEQPEFSKVREQTMPSHSPDNNTGKSVITWNAGLATSG
jgi:hypothetical protein